MAEFADVYVIGGAFPLFFSIFLLHGGAEGIKCNCSKVTTVCLACAMTFDLHVHADEMGCCSSCPKLVNVPAPSCSPLDILGSAV